MEIGENGANMETVVRVVILVRRSGHGNVTILRQLTAGSFVQDPIARRQHAIPMPAQVTKLKTFS